MIAGKGEESGSGPVSYTIEWNHRPLLNPDISSQDHTGFLVSDMQAIQETFGQ